MRLIKTIPGKSFAFWENRGREFLGTGTGWVLGDLSGVSIVLRLGPALFNGIVSDPWIDKISFQVFVAPILVKRDILAGE